MGNYTEASKILFYYTNLEYSADNIMTEGKVNHLIENNEASFDAILQTIGYETVPLTNAGDILVARQYVEWMVVCEVDKVLRESDEDSKFDYKRNYCNMAEKFIQKLIDGTIEFSEMRDEDSPNMFNNIDSEGKEVEPFFKIQNIRDQLCIDNI